MYYIDVLMLRYCRAEPIKLTFSFLFSSKYKVKGGSSKHVWCVLKEKSLLFYKNDSDQVSLFVFIRQPYGWYCSVK